MKKLFVGVVLTVACLVPWVCQAQYYYYPGYGYYYFNPQSQGRQGYYSPPPVSGPATAPPTTMYQRWQPDPRMIRRWDQQNRVTDYFEPLRSPLNRESDLDYMMRTF